MHCNLCQPCEINDLSTGTKEGFDNLIYIYIYIYGKSVTKAFLGRHTIQTVP